VLTKIVYDRGMGTGLNLQRTVTISFVCFYNVLVFIFPHTKAIIPLMIKRRYTVNIFRFHNENDAFKTF
jgi:hypothetical protein